MEWAVKILKTEPVTHDVKRFVVERPPGYSFLPGQATMVSLDRPGWKDETRPFTFTSLNEDRSLEFTIKSYEEHDGVTRALHKLKPGDGIMIRETFGTISYRGPGVFIAGGAGITPFIAILRRLKKDGRIEGNRLIFSNKTAKDIILENELKEMLGSNLVLTLTRESREGYENRRVDRAFLQEKVKDFHQHFYVCGPQAFVEGVSDALEELGAKPDSIVFEGG